jgi:exonuclease VII large subunit
MGEWINIKLLYDELSECEKNLENAKKNYSAVGGHYVNLHTTCSTFCEAAFWDGPYSVGAKNVIKFLTLFIEVSAINGYNYMEPYLSKGMLKRFTKRNYELVHTYLDEFSKKGRNYKTKAVLLKNQAKSLKKEYKTLFCENITEKTEHKFKSQQLVIDSYNKKLKQVDYVVKLVKGYSGAINKTKEIIEEVNNEKQNELHQEGK